MQERRTQRPPVRDRKRYERIEKLTEALVREVKEIKPRVPWSHTDPLEAFWELKRRAEANRIGYEMIGATFSGRRNPDRAHLYGRILDLWVVHLDQELKYSRSPKRASGGPLIRFVMACVESLGNPPSSHTIAGIIDRERRARRRYGALKTEK
jgi:hypothetical protein